MSPAQIIRTIGIALISGGSALGLVPTGACGAGWWSFPMPERSFGWFAYEGLSHQTTIGSGWCEAALAPVGSWAIALVAAGVALLVTLRLNNPRRTTDEPTEWAGHSAPAPVRGPPMSPMWTSRP